MLNITLAAEAATRPLAGFGAGAFACDGAWAGSPVNQLAAGQALPRIRGAFAAVPPLHARTAGAFGGGYQASSVGISTVGVSTVDGNAVGIRNGSAKQLNQMTRIYPVTPGGVGPHPAREPDPV
jgi:hypothetical protein